MGTIVKASEQEDVLCFISVLNVAQQLGKGVKGMEQIAGVLRRWARSADGGAHKKAMDKALASSRTGLIISERLMGMPKEIAGPLHQALFDEVAWATEDEVRRCTTTTQQ